MIKLNTENYVVWAEPRTPEKGPAMPDTDALDSFLTEWGEKNAAHIRETRLAHDRERQARFFGTFLLPVPDAAVEHPIVPIIRRPTFGLYSKAHGYTIQSETFPARYKIDPATLRAVCVSPAIKDCDSALVPSFLRELVDQFGADMVFRAWNWIDHLEYEKFIEGVLAKYALPLANTNFRFADRSVPFTHTLNVSGAIIPVHHDHLGPVECPEALTPWMRALLARSDAHAILVDVVRAMRSESP